MGDLIAAFPILEGIIWEGWRGTRENGFKVREWA